SPSTARLRAYRDLGVRVPPMTAAPTNLQAGLERLLSRLRSPQVTFFPIRHHSPACAAHLRRWILEQRPAAVPVEGPASSTSHLPFLVDERCRCPVAIYTNFVDQRGRLARQEGAAQEPHSAADAPRFSGYYPFCDYSPELVALRTGQEVGARLSFI